MDTKNLAVAGPQGVTVYVKKDLHTCRLYDGHLNGDGRCTDGLEGKNLLAVISEVVGVTFYGDGSITLTRVSQDDVSVSVAPGYRQRGHTYSIVQLVLLVTVNDALVPSVAAFQSSCTL